MCSRGCWLGLPLLLTAMAGGQGGPGSPAPHRVKRGFTYPGTLWCGAGNNAESYEQLGEYVETDRCCRAHDQCQHVIHPFAVGYGHHNFRWHTISHCDCDERLKECLRQADDDASRAVGQAFFNVIRAPCFELTPEEQCVERYWYGWCKNYGPVPRAVLREPILYEFGAGLLHVPSHTSPPAAPGPGIPTRQALPPAWDGKAAKKGRKKKKETRKRKKGSFPTWHPGPGLQLAKELASKASGPRAWKPDRGGKDPSFDVLLDEPKAEGPTEAETWARPHRGRRKGHRRKLASPLQA
ncbi:protein PROCA1 [Monodelphis domestica]|uniref:protein PROCA1 n=1 Tax=Monodelphis domestica TaxID=13616 RepID=UPI0004431049|nr:protein PROCA1 [Monodelphis domestica]